MYHLSVIKVWIFFFLQIYLKTVHFSLPPLPPVCQPWSSFTMALSFQLLFLLDAQPEPDESLFNLQWCSPRAEEHTEVGRILRWTQWCQFPDIFAIYSLCPFRASKTERMRFTAVIKLHSMARVKGFFKYYGLKSIDFEFIRGDYSKWAWPNQVNTSKDLGSSWRGRFKDHKFICLFWSSELPYCEKVHILGDSGCPWWGLSSYNYKKNWILLISNRSGQGSCTLGEIMALGDTLISGLWDWYPLE